MKKKPSYLEVLPTALALIMVWMMIGLVLYWLAYAPPAFCSTGWCLVCPIS